MPYDGQSAGKGGHSDFVKNPDVQAFLSRCTYMREPSDEEGRQMASSFIPAPTLHGENLPKLVIASDASKKDDPIYKDKFPSTQIGFIKISHVLIKMEHYSSLANPENRFVDPLGAAALHKNAHPVTFVLPGSNIFYDNAPDGRTGFRAAVFEQLSKARNEDDNARTLTDTLIKIWKKSELTLPCCRTCGDETPFVFSDSERRINCLMCGQPNFVTDLLRLDENVSDFGNNTGAITRMMNALEHLFLSHFLYDIINKSPQSLSSIAFVMDGPLAIFGEPAKLHARILRQIFMVNERLIELGLDPMLIIGLQKTGTVMEHAASLNRHLPKGVLRLIDDPYRNQFISRSDAPNFGHETYYGQDFLFKTEAGNMFNFAIPYPFKDKTNARNFASEKANIAKYGNLIARACDLVRHFEMDLYESAIVPVALAHRHASISMVPGGRVLDILAEAALETRS